MQTVHEGETKDLDDCRLPKESLLYVGNRELHDKVVVPWVALEMDDGRNEDLDHSLDQSVPMVETRECCAQ